MIVKLEIFPQIVVKKKIFETTNTFITSKKKNLPGNHQTDGSSIPNFAAEVPKQLQTFDVVHLLVCRVEGKSHGKNS